MIGAFNIVSNHKKNFVFYCTSSGDWQVWKKPPSAKMVSMYVVGGGGGGGAGGWANTSSASTGGGGGGSSAISFGVFPAYVVPDILYVSVGAGGDGGVFGAASPNAVAGELSYVSAAPDTSAINVFLASGNTSGGGAGGNGTGGGTTLGTAGSAGPVLTAANAILSNLGIITSTIGRAGAASTLGVGTSITISATAPYIPFSGGASGGSKTSAPTYGGGGAINAFAFLPAIAGGGAAATGFVAGAGRVGYSTRNTFEEVTQYPALWTGGSGGGAGGTGSKGGEGAFGCGGGGGGAGLIGSGAGGRGGDGFVLITVA